MQVRGRDVDGFRLWPLRSLQACCAPRALHTSQCMWHKVVILQLESCRVLRRPVVRKDQLAGAEAGRGLSAAVGGADLPAAGRKGHAVEPRQCVFVPHAMQAARAHRKRQLVRVVSSRSIC